MANEGKIKIFAVCILLLFGILGGMGKIDKEMRLFPEEQVVIERCIALCNAKRCPNSFIKSAPDPVTGETSCELACKKLRDCNDMMESMLLILSDRKKVFNSTSKNEDFKEECAAHCEQVTGQEPLPGAKGAASVKMAKSECKIRCKIASYVASD